MPGEIAQADVTLEGPPTAIFALLVEGDLTDLAIPGSHAAARRLAGSIAAGATAQPAAARRSSSQARETSASIVR